MLGVIRVKKPSEIFGGSNVRRISLSNMARRFCAEPAKGTDSQNCGEGCDDYSDFAINVQSKTFFQFRSGDVDICNFKC